MNTTNFKRLGKLGTLFGAALGAHCISASHEVAQSLGLSLVAAGSLHVLSHVFSEQFAEGSQKLVETISPKLEKFTQKAIINAYVKTVSAIELEVADELNVKESLMQKLGRHLFNKENENNEIAIELKETFFFPLIDILTENEKLVGFFEAHVCLNIENVIESIVISCAPHSENELINNFAQDISRRFAKHYPSFFLLELQSDDDARNGYFTIVLESILRNGFDQKDLIKQIISELRLATDSIDEEHVSVRRLLFEVETEAKQNFLEIKSLISNQREPILVRNDESDMQGSAKANEPNLFNYKTRYTRFTGRNNSLSDLLCFLKDTKSHFCWWAIIGPGGIGKSRLALEFIDVAAKEGFYAGFFDVASAHDWSHWVPTKPTLVVIDYAFSQHRRVSNLIKTLHKNRDLFRRDVRLLLLDREISKNWEEVEKEIEIRNSAYKLDGEILPLDLPSLDEDSYWTIFTQVFEDNDFGLSEQKIINLKQKKREILDSFYSLDEKKRPLYAFFCALALTAEDNIRNWNSKRLLEYHLSRLENNVWRKVEGYDSVAPLIKKLLFVNTLCGALSAENLAELIEQFGSGMAPSTLAELYSKISDYTNGTFVGIRPDLLGEYFVLDTLEKMVFALIPEKNLVVRLLNYCWRKKPEHVCMMSFMAWDDFNSKYETISSDFDLIQELNDQITLSQDQNAVEHLIVLYVNIGSRAFDREEYDKAIECGNKAIELSPSSWPGYVLSATAKGMKELKKSGSKANMSDSFRDIAILHLRTVDKNQRIPLENRDIIAILDDALIAFPADYNLYQYRAGIHHGRGNHENAIRDFSFLIKYGNLDSESLSYVYVIRGDSYAAINMKEFACRDYYSGLRLGDDSAISRIKSNCSSYPESKSNFADGRKESGIGRNEKCPCGSGKKYKQCHGKM